MPPSEDGDLDQLVVPADVELLGVVRAWVRRRAEPGAFSDRDLADIELAVAEAVSNVIHHAYAEKRRYQVDIRAGLKDARLVIRIIDTGPPCSAVSSDSDRDPGHEDGYGLGLISTVMDDATWTRLPDGRNELRLVRLCPGLQA